MQTESSVDSRSPVNTMATITAYDGEAIRLGMLLNYVPHLAVSRSRPHWPRQHYKHTHARTLCNSTHTNIYKQRRGIIDAEGPKVWQVIIQLGSLGGLVSSTNGCGAKPQPTCILVHFELHTRPLVRMIMDIFLPESTNSIFEYKKIQCFCVHSAIYNKEQNKCTWNIKHKNSAKCGMVGTCIYFTRVIP